jgi:carbon-monoxide dehydrogenase large subunit
MTGLADRPKSVGSRVSWVEDPRLLSGRARYIDDIRRPGMLHLSIARSQLAHARILEIDSEAALALCDDVQVFTAEHTRGLGISANQDLPGVQTSRQPVLAEGRVRVVGEPVVAVLASDAYKAEDAAELVFIDYEPLPVIASAEAAMRPEAPRMFDGWRHNLFVERQMKGGDIERARAEAAHVVRRTYRTHRQAGVPLECRGVVAEFDAATRRSPCGRRPRSRISCAPSWRRSWTGRKRACGCSRPRSGAASASRARCSWKSCWSLGWR